jgi:hypothetical protein
VEPELAGGDVSPLSSSPLQATTDTAIKVSTASMGMSVRGRACVRRAGVEASFKGIAPS